MAQMQVVGRLFVLYGRDPERRWVLHDSAGVVVTCSVMAGVEDVIEDTEYRPFEHHRFGQGYVVHLGPWCFGAGAFERGLTEEEFRRIEEQAVWFDAEPEDIGRWRGGKEPDAEDLGHDFTVTRGSLVGEDRGEAPGASPADEHGGAEALG